IIGISALSGILWGVLGPAPSAAYAIMTSSAVLLCACPCAFGLASPLSTLIAGLKSIKEGIFVRDIAAFEKAGQVTCVVFDKTGTLTDDVPTVQEPLVYFEGADEAL